MNSVFERPLVSAIVSSILCEFEKTEMHLKAALSSCTMNEKGRSPEEDQLATAEMQHRITDFVAMALHMQNRHDAAYALLDEERQMRTKDLGGEKADESLARCMSSLGISSAAAGRFSDALSFFAKELAMRQELSLERHEKPSDPAGDLRIAQCRNQLGTCAQALQQFHEAVHHYEHELLIRQTAKACGKLLCALHPSKDPDEASCLVSLAFCLLNIGQIREAEKCFSRALLVRQLLSRDETTDRSIAQIYFHLCHCCFVSNRFLIGLENGSKAFAIHKHVPFLKNDVQLAAMFSYGGQQLYLQGDYENSLKCLRFESELYNLVVGNQTLNAHCQYSMGRCYQKLGECYQASKCLRKALELQSTDIAGENDSLKIALALCSVGMQLHAQENYEEAMRCLTPLTNPNCGTERNSTVGVQSKIGIISCHLALGHAEEAYKICQEVFQQPTLLHANMEFLSFGVSASRFMGLYSKGLHNYKDALECYRREMQYSELLSASSGSDLDASLLRKCIRNIGICLFKIKQYSEALGIFQQELEVLEASSV